MKRDRLIERMGAEVVRFQEESNAFDDVAAQILALDRTDLACMTLLLFAGPASVDQLTAALHRPRSTVTVTLDRLQLAGYARRCPGAANDRGPRVELTEHAREWIGHIWEPLRTEGGRILAAHSTRELEIMVAFMVRARGVQERQVRQLRKWLTLPASPARRAHLRGGLSPAALRRVQLFVEANLHRTIQLGDLAERAGLSLHHFARAFRTSAGVTPRAFVEQRRVERAKRLMAESNASLADIAASAGFSTQSRLTTTFKRHTGFTPAAFRRGKSAPNAPVSARLSAEL